MQNQKLTTLQNEVIEFYQEIKTCLSPDISFNEDYLGYRIFFGELLENPKVLFIGFNPGNGMKDVERVEPQEFEYYDDNYPLANNARKVFEAINKLDWFENDLVTKINFYYLITENVNSYNLVMRKLPTELKYKFWDKSKRWTKELIEIINPTYIICEGSMIYWEVSNLLATKQIETNINGSLLSLEELKNRKVFGFERVISNYKNINGFIELLQNEMI